MQDAFSSDIEADLGLLQISIALIVIYCFLVLGNFSPVRCRSVLAFVGILCIGLAYASAYGLASIFGQKTSGIHNLLAFLMIGIGADDMFVITSAADQLPTDMAIPEVMGRTISKAGVSITITSFTNVMAFLLGSATTLPALSSFCVYCALGILFDYLYEISIFSAALAMDLRRQQRKRGDCCGACCCSEAVWICCFGSCLPKTHEPKIEPSPKTQEQKAPET